MRRFSSESSLLDMDSVPWKKLALKEPGFERYTDSYTPCSEKAVAGARSTSMAVTNNRMSVVCFPRDRELTKELSISAENFTHLNKQDNNYLCVGSISESCRAYSDGQLAPAAQGSSECVDAENHSQPSHSSPNSHKSHLHHPRQTKAKLTSAKLHLKSLFGQSPHSSHSNLFQPEQKDSAKERRSRLKFMRQWSQVGHSKAKFSREELEKWSESLSTLLASQMGTSVFGAFLRSEFSEENLQFYLACEQYRQSSNNFSLQRRAKEICNTYILSGATREVNLDSKTKELTLQLLQAPSRTSLSHAQKRIYALLDTDCYPRFLQSNLYLSLLTEADN